MIVEISPSTCNGSVKIPPSKSMAHRAIIAASLSNGTSKVSNIAYSKDIIATIEAMKLLGATITQNDDELIIQGIKDFTQIKNRNVFCNESGSTLRFLIPLFSLCNQEIHFTGAGRLMQRPQKIYEEIFHAKGLDFIHTDEEIIIHQTLPAGEFVINGDVSSQFISGLLFTLPLLNDDSIIHILPPFESKSYVNLTIQMLEAFQIHIEWMDDFTLKIKGNQKYIPHDYIVEGDYSQLAFFAVWAAINGSCSITGVNHNSKQGDKQIIDILKLYGANITEIPFGYKVEKNKLEATTIDLSNCPDLGPILCILGMYANGKTTITNASRLRIKESDRIATMEEELQKFNVNISSTQDEIYIEGSSNYTCNQELYGHNDHRIVMALSVASACANSITRIADAQAITKSYPNYFEDYKKVNGKVHEI